MSDYFSPFTPTSGGSNPVSHDHELSLKGRVQRTDLRRFSANASLVEPKRLIQTNRSFGSNLGKGRDLNFFLANHKFKTISDLGNLEFSELEQSKLRDLEIFFDNWRSHYFQRYVHLERNEDSKHIFIKQHSRFDESYRSHLRRKLHLLDNMLWDLKIELTIDPKKCMRLEDEFYLLRKGWNRLNSWLKRRFEVESYPFFDVLEIQKSGRPHLHVLISGVKWIEQSELSDLWDSYGCGKIVYIKRVHSRNNLKMSAYVMKYVNKTLNQADRRFAALLFASNRRLFSMSRGCQNMVNVGRVKKENQGFSYVGSVAEGEIRAYCDERAVELSDFMVFDVDRVDLYEFPILFGCEAG